MRYVIFARGQIFHETDNRAAAIACCQAGQVLGDREANKLWDLQLQEFVTFPGIAMPLAQGQGELRSLAQRLAIDLCYLECGLDAGARGPSLQTVIGGLGIAVDCWNEYLGD